MNRIILSLVCLLPFSAIRSQTVIGTPGLMNIPTADMREGCTFDGGGSFMQRELQSENMPYNTWLYYVSFSPFSFIDITLRETLLKTQKSSRDTRVGYYQQDRSLSVRLRILSEKEKKWWPSVLVGTNDFYSSHGDSYYAAVYGVLTKTIPLSHNGTFSASLGYARPIKMGILYDGVFGGFSYSPSFAPMAKAMCEYDTRGYNIGIGAHLFRHLNVTCFTREFKGVSATVSYQYTIKLKR